MKIYNICFATIILSHLMLTSCVPAIETATTKNQTPSEKPTPSTPATPESLNDPSNPTVDPTNDSGWVMVASSGNVKMKEQGGATDGQVSGLFSVIMTDANIGYAVGNLGEVLKTTDGGETSTTLKGFPSSGTLHSVDAFSEDEILISGRDTQNEGSSVWTSEDSGQSFAVIFNTASAYPGRSLSSMDRLNQVIAHEDNGFYIVGGLGDNTALIMDCDEYNDCYELYRDAPSGLDDEFYSMSLINNDSEKLIVVGNHGVIMRSSDAGATWEMLDTGAMEHLYDVACHENLCVIVGAAGTLFVSHDSGDSFTKLNINTGEDLNTVFITESGLIWMGGSKGLILFSDDSLQSYSEQESNTEFPVLDIFMTDDENGVAMCANTSSNTGAILMTHTGGK